MLINTQTVSGCWICYWTSRQTVSCLPCWRSWVADLPNLLNQYRREWMVSLLALIEGQNWLFALQGGHKYLVKQDDTGDHDIHVYIYGFCHWKVCPGWNRLNPLKTKKSVLKSNQGNHKLLVLRDLVAEKHIVYGKVSLVLFRKSSSQILKSTGPRPTWSHWDCSFTRVSRAGVEQTRPPQHYGPGEPPQAKMALISQSRSGRRSLRIYIVFHRADWRVDVQSLMIEFVVSLSNDAPTYESND